MDYLLDSNIIIIYSRDNDISNLIEQQYQLFSGNHRLFLSVVSLGETNALVKKLQLGKRRQHNIEQILSSINKIGINFAEIIDRYGDIDAFSQGKSTTKKGNFTARNMGKNDLWIAATSSVYDLILLTTDKDFNHLDGDFLNLEYIDIEAFKNS